MDFLKKHYEKVILGLVLFGLAVAVGFLPFKITSDREELQQKATSLLQPPVQPLTNIDMNLAELAIKRLATPAPINFGAPNRLFNPMPWQKSADGRLIPADKAGPKRLTITDITPLYLIISLDSVALSEMGSNTVAKYVIGIQDQAAAAPRQRNKTQAYCSMNPPTKNDTFTMLEVKGKPEDPSQVIVQLNDTGEKAVLTKDHDFKRVDGYMADLRYAPEKKAWEKQRVGSLLYFNGEQYEIVAVGKDEVVLSAKSNQKKWTIKYQPSSLSDSH